MDQRVLQPPEAMIPAEYGHLHELAERALDNRQLEKACALFESAYDLVAEQEGTVLSDRAFCNLVAVEIELKAMDEVVSRLRDILVRHNDTENCRLAAYHLARIYDRRGEYRKALFYARIARERSDQLGRPDWMASSRNQAGNALLAESHFDQAAAQYEEALELLAGVHEGRSLLRKGDMKEQVSLALILDSLGYCRFVQKRYRDGFKATFEALRILRRCDARRLEALAHVTLCFGYLESERYRPAARHGIRALALAEEVGDEESLKRSLFLMGEVLSTLGDSDGAYEYFSRLQRRFYPEQSYLADFLLAVDVRQLVNLKG